MLLNNPYVRLGIIHYYNKYVSIIYFSHFTYNKQKQFVCIVNIIDYVICAVFNDVGLTKEINYKITLYIV